MRNSSTQKDFAHAAKSPNPQRPKTASPLSIRFTYDEKAILKREAGDTALSTYIREKLLGDQQQARKAYCKRKPQTPRVDAASIARMLSMLGQSELAPALIALATAAQSGTLPVTEELCGKLNTACDDVRRMRIALITCLGIKAE